MDLGAHTIRHDEIRVRPMKHYSVGVGMVRASGSTQSTTYSVVATNSKFACDLAIGIAKLQCYNDGWKGFHISSISDSGILPVE